MQPEIEISKRCLSCGASLRPKAHFCSQCGKTVEQDETQALNEFKVETKIDLFGNEEDEAMADESVSEVEAFSTQHTVPLETQNISVTENIAQESLSVESEVENDAVSVWTNFEEKEEVEVKEEGWSETSRTVALPVEAVPLMVTPDKTKSKPENLLEEINNRVLEEQSKSTLKTFGVPPKLSATERAQRLMQRTRHSHTRVKEIVEKSQEKLDRASPDPSLRFAIISIGIFLITLFLFLLSRVLK
jgi:predicted nucleic acid-binding Zn ribbon protein